MDVRRMIVVLSVAVMAALWSAVGGGCATLTSGVTQPIEVRTDPSGATVVADGVVRGTTPCIVRLYRGRDATLEIRKAGYVSETVFITTRMDGDVMAKVFGGAIVGGAFDLATGAAMKLAPDAITLSLRPGGEGDGAVGVAAGAAAAVGGVGNVGGAAMLAGGGVPGGGVGVDHPVPMETTGDRGVATAGVTGVGSGAANGGGAGGVGGAGAMSAELEARLAAIDELLARGILTQAEHAKARERAIAEAVSAGGAGGGGTSVGGVTTP